MREQTIGQQRASFAARGINVTSGSVNDILNETIHLAAQDFLALREDFLNAQTDIQFSISQLKAARKNRKRGLPLAIAGQVVGGASDLAALGQSGGGPASA